MLAPTEETEDLVEFHDPLTHGDAEIPCHLKCLPMSTDGFRRAARVALLVVAFCTAMSQWSALGSGVAFFQHQGDLGENRANVLSSATLSVCFLSSIVGGILGDATMGLVNVLILGLATVLIATLGLAVAAFPTDAFSNKEALHLTSDVFLFIFAIGCGICQTAVPNMVGDQCTDDPQRLQVLYAVFYGVLQLGAFIARVFFPLVHDHFDWFVAIVAFLVAPIAASLLIFGFNSSLVRYKLPLHSSTAVRAATIAIRRLFGTPKDELQFCYGDKIVRDTCRSLSVLKLHLPLPLFWALYFQMFGLWYIQSKRMDLHIAGVSITAEQATLLNPLLDVVLLGFFAFTFWLIRGCCGVVVRAHVKILLGYLCAALSFVCATLLQRHIEASDHLSVNVLYQLPQYFFVCAAEVLVYPSALHLAYVHSPNSMRSFVQSCLWFFIGIGNGVNTIVTASVTSLDPSNDKTDNFLWLYAAYTIGMTVALIGYVFLMNCYYDDVVSSGDTFSGRPLMTSEDVVPGGAINHGTFVPAAGAQQQQQQPSPVHADENKGWAAADTLNPPQRRAITPRQGIQYYSTKKSHSLLSTEAK